MHAVRKRRIMEKLASRTKEAQFETARHGIKALWQTFRGGKGLKAAEGSFLPERKAAVGVGEDLIRGLHGSGMKVHRARIKTPASMEAQGLTSVPDDLLGLQLFGKGPESVSKVLKALKEQGVTGIRTSAKTRPGYHGVNIKGSRGGTPVEVQVAPSRRSLFGSLLEHPLGYKVKTEAPLATRFDKWVGKRVAPKLVRSGSWVPRMNQAPALSRPRLVVRTPRVTARVTAQRSWRPSTLAFGAA